MSQGASNEGDAAMKGNKTRPSLLLRLRNFRDQASWDEFVALYAPLILRFLCRIGVRRDRAVEMVNDVLVIVVCKIRTFEYDPAKGKFRGWLATIARNRAYKSWRDGSRQPMTPGGTTHAAVIRDTPGKDDAVDELIETEWQKRRLELAIAKVRAEVTARAWEIFEALVIQELPPAVVAARLGMNPGTVYTAKCRVLHRLREIVEEIDE
jgi:RNA polymerase sigma-70 factor (ECF subfamily)